MIPPTVGRIVHYRPGQPSPEELGFIPGMAGIPPRVLAAIITAVHTDRLVNLSVFTETGDVRREQRVPLLQDDDTAPTSIGYCQWMEYQKGQAAKAEALEAKLGKPASLAMTRAQAIELAKTKATTLPMADQQMVAGVVDVLEAIGAIRLIDEPEPQLAAAPTAAEPPV